MGSEAGSCFINTGLNTKPQTFCKELNISKTTDQAKSATIAMNMQNTLLEKNI